MLRGWRVQVLRLPWRPKGSFWPGVSEEQTAQSPYNSFFGKDMLFRCVRHVLRCENRIVRWSWDGDRERERGGVGISRCQVELSAMIRWRNIHSASFNVEIPHVDVVLSIFLLFWTCASSRCHVAARREDWKADREDGRRPQWRKHVPLFWLKMVEVFSHNVRFT